jgi:hypothetical protein
MCDEEREHQRRSRSRRRCFGRRSNAGSPSASSSEGRLAPPSANPMLSSLFCSPDDRAKPLCVINQTASIDRTEADLRRALLVTVGGNRPTVSKFQVLEEVSRAFNIAVNSMVVMVAAPEDFLLMLPDTTVADRVFNRGLSLYGPEFSLHFKWWTRLALAAGAVLPSFVDVELRGLPAHMLGN